MRAFVVAAVLGFASVGVAGPKVDVIVGPEAPTLDKLAAEELAGQLRRIYHAEVTQGTAVPENGGALILVGNPTSNSAIPAEAWPKLTDQGHIVRSVSVKGRPALVVGGGSPVATFWAACEHGYRLGVRVFTFGDLDPVSPPAFTVENWNVLMEPRLKTRGFVTLNPSDTGLTAWGLEDQKRLLGQLAKLKFNHLVIHLEPWYPCEDWSWSGNAGSPKYLHFPEAVDVSGDVVGRLAFKSTSRFDNDDQINAKTDGERLVLGQKLVREVQATAKSLGMTTCLSLTPWCLPRELGTSVPDAELVSDDFGSWVAPAEGARSDDPLWLEVCNKRLNSLLRNFPECEDVEIRCITGNWRRDAARVWHNLLIRNGHKNPPAFADAMQAGAYFYGDEFKVLSYDAASRIYDRRSTWLPPGRVARFRILSDTPSDSYSNALSQMLPPAFAFTRDAKLHHEDRLLVPPPRNESYTNLLASTGQTMLPENVLMAVMLRIDAIEHKRWEGLTISSRDINDIDPTLHLFSRATFDRAISARESLRNLVSPVCGDDAFVSVERAFDSAEQATTFVLTLSVEGLLLAQPDFALEHRSWINASKKRKIAACREHFTSAMNEMYRANTRSREGGRAFTLYFARRFEFAVEFLTACETIFKAIETEDSDQRLTELQNASDALHRAGTAMAAVARNPSDRAVVALLNRDWYRPLTKMIEQLESAEK